MMIVGYGIFPPEINSQLMYTGPGSGSLAAAAASWDMLADELAHASSAYRTIIADLLSGPWQGPSATRMAEALLPYVLWMSETGVKAEQTARNINLAIGAYEAAHGATVPPAVVAENRLELMVLIATNFFGQNTPAIAANWAAYYSMWAQDAIAMDTYAQVASCARALSSFDSPPQVNQPLNQPLSTSDQLISSAASVAHVLGEAHLASTHALVESNLAESNVAEETTSTSSTAHSGFATLATTATSSSTTHSAAAHAASATGIVHKFLSKPANFKELFTMAVTAPWYTSRIMSFTKRGLAAIINAALNSMLGGSGISAFSPVTSLTTFAHVGNAGLVGSLSVPPSWSQVPGIEGISGGLMSKTEFESGMQQIKATLVHATSASKSAASAQELLDSLPMFAANASRDHSHHSAVLKRLHLRSNVIPHCPAAG